MLISRLAAFGLLALLAIPARADFVSLEGDPPDYDYLSTTICCVDVAAGNMLAYLARHKKRVKDTLKDPKTEQEDFHKRYDPEFKSPGSATADQAKSAWEKTLADKGLEGSVKLFRTGDLSYETLVKEWKDDEIIMLLMSSGGRIGHAVFLWGLDDDPKAAEPEISVVDPNVHPNTDQNVDGKATKSKGTASKVKLAIGKDGAGLPEWRITTPGGPYRYPEDPEFEYAWPAQAYRITAFISVSDVGTIPVPGALLLLGPAVVVLLVKRHLG
ncbi:MAG: hypothetical protein FJX57_02895 [Alphaproteobacteria bacterium]|nr:hypothetical protein [Alphaproteobacteria bacterium]